MEYTIWLHAQVQRLLLKELGWLVKMFKLICELCDQGALSGATWRCGFALLPSRSSFALDLCDTRASDEGARRASKARGKPAAPRREFSLRSADTR